MKTLAKISNAVLGSAIAVALTPANAEFGPGDAISGIPIYPTNRGGFCIGPDCVPGEIPFGATQNPDCNFAGPGNPVPLYPDDDNFSSYPRFSNNFNWGVNFQPNDSFRLRGTYGTSFRKPNIAELFGSSAVPSTGSSATTSGTGSGAASGPQRAGAGSHPWDSMDVGLNEYFNQIPGHSLSTNNFYDRFKNELPRGGFDVGLPGAYGNTGNRGLNYKSPSVYFKFFPPADDIGINAWPWHGSSNADPGADSNPIFRNFDDDGRIHFNETDFDLVSRYSMFNSWSIDADRFSSVNFQTPPGGVPQPFQPLVSQQFGIGDVDWTSLTFNADYLSNVSNALNEVEIVFEINGCRFKALPTDPNFVQTGRGSWGQAEDDQWAIKRVGFTNDETSAWNQVPDDATPVIVAVVDTGLDWHHLDISPDNIWRNEDEIPGNGVDDDGNGYVDDLIGWDFLARNNKPWDFDGHGTIVAGIIAAAQNNGAGIAGINPHAKLMILKAVNNFGNSRPSYLAEAIVYAANNGARVINLSVGGPRASKMEQAAIAYAHEKGVLVVAASGNEGIELDDYGPGGGDNVLTVGATFTDDRAAAFSNYGDKIDMVAPGVDVLSLRARYTDANYRPDNEEEYALGTNYVGQDKRYIHVSGTSFAAPIVAATASLMMAKNPEMTAAEVQELLQQTAEDIETPGRDQYTGYGLVNARAALGVGAGFELTAEITGVEPVQTDAGVVLQIKGTIDADGFKRGWMQIGAGENPGAWKYVGQKRKYPIRDGVLGTVPLNEFAGADVWQIVMNVEHKNGVRKSTRFQVRLN